MKPIVRDFMVGATVLGGLVALVVGLMFFGELTLERRYEVHVRLFNASGLSKASRVTMNGVSIGEVHKTSIVPPPEGGVELTLRINDSITIPRKAVIGIDKGLIGDASLDFGIPRELTAADLADAIKEGETFDGGNPSSMFDKITQALDKPLARFSQTAERIEQLAETYIRVGVRVEEALEPRSLDEVAAGKSPNLRSLIARIDRTLEGADQVIRDEDLVAGIKRVVAKAETTMNDAQGLVADLRAAAGKVDGFIDSADRTVKSVESAAGTAERTMATLAESATATLRSAEDAAGKLAGVLDAAAKGEGTFGKLLTNPDLYDSLKDATDRLDKALAEFQLLAEKFRTEGVRLRL